ncbi:MAG: phosphoribosylanthranilate isomerase [Pseudomonadota bacterium]
MRVKICGLTRPEDVTDAVGAGADYIGFVFFPPSPRVIDIETGRALMRSVPPGVSRVALTVNPDDDLLDRLDALPIDFVQLHGDESPERVAKIRERQNGQIIKAIGIRDPEDVELIERYAPVSDQLLLDAKPPYGASRPGGNAVVFDWGLIAGYDWPLPWLLAGGLTTSNIADAIRTTAAEQVDLSSAVESAPGIKNKDLMQAFITAARAA